MLVLLLSVFAALFAAWGIADGNMNIFWPIVAIITIIFVFCVYLATSNLARKDEEIEKMHMFEKLLTKIFFNTVEENKMRDFSNDFLEIYFIEGLSDEVLERILALIFREPCYYSKCAEVFNNYVSQVDVSNLEVKREKLQHLKQMIERVKHDTKYEKTSQLHSDMRRR